MRVTMLVTISGTRNGEDWPAKGGVIDLPAAEAADYIAAGLCAAASPAPESAAAPKPETAATPKPRTRKATS